MAINKSTYLSLVIIFFGSILTASVSLAEQSKQSLGMILPLSGDAAAIGDAVKNGAELAYLELKPSTKEKFKLLFEDDSLSPKNAVSAFQNLHSKENLIAIAAVSSGIGHALAPLAESNHIPFIGIGVSDATVSKDRKYSFLHWITPEVQMEAIVKELEIKNYRKVGFLIASQEGYYSMRIALKKLISNSNITLVLDEEMPQSEKDFNSYLVRINKIKDLEALFVGLMPGQNALFVKKLRQSASKLQIIGGELFDNPDEQSAAGASFKGAFYAAPAAPSNNFIISYKARFPQASLFAAANGYDTVKLVADYLENGAPSQSLDLFLRSLKNFPGACGLYSYSEGGKFSLPVQIKVIS